MSAYICVAILCTRPAGQLFQGPEEALSEKDLGGRQEGDQEEFLSRSHFISEMVVAYIALE